MGKRKKSSREILLISLIAILLFPASVFFSLFLYSRSIEEKRQDPKYNLSVIIQTSPLKVGLTSEYLSELLGLSLDRPTNYYDFDVKRGELLLKASPLIKEAKIKLLKPHTLYIDYIPRKPIAWLYEYENTAIDEEGYLFPVSPFFSPKELPEIYLGLAPFGVPSENDKDLPKAKWGAPLSGKYFQLAMDILRVTKQLKVKRIDVSKAFEPSLGSREIVLLLEDEAIVEVGGQKHLALFPRVLRLPLKDYAKQIAAFSQLKPSLNTKEIVHLPNGNSYLQIFPQQVVDLRIENAGYIQELNYGPQK